MTTSPFDLLSVECDMDCDQDMTQVPGWDKLDVRAQPTLMLHLSDSCPCECFLQTATSPCVSPSEDELATILDDNLDMVCYENDSFLYEMLNEMSLVADDFTESNSPSTDSVTQTLDEGLPNGQSLIDFLSDPYIGGDVSSSPDSSEWSSSSPLSSSVSSSDSLDFDDMFPVSPNPPERKSCLTPHRKRKHSDVSQDAVKRKCCHGDELFSTLDRITSQPIVSDVNEIKYGFYVTCEDV
ncbi:uncharacterized protein LOC110442411 [Mizuhopecten yessoensis]|uniref:Uncharacterized protein n=1 Tax=Mizuhopecten yessoensis TaxID=6573 RepID=A0A210PHA7_MIZYE|nr:uncharacterized protein LOC110442411 [Mizuhopecten yessoensis]OWF35871.1 hypothetical protein KP79_PYT04952 [Mizuhopecten yessoensis]